MGYKRSASQENKDKSAQNKFLNEYITQGYHLTNTLKATKFLSKTYYRWLDQYPEFKKAIENLRERDVDLMEDAFRDLIKERNPQSVIFGLKTRGAHRGYQERQEIQHFGANEIVVKFEKPGNDAIDVTPENEAIEHNE